MANTDVPVTEQKRLKLVELINYADGLIYKNRPGWDENREGHDNSSRYDNAIADISEAIQAYENGEWEIERVVRARRAVEGYAKI